MVCGSEPGTKAVTFVLAVFNPEGQECDADVTLGPYCEGHAAGLEQLLIKHGVSINILGALTTHLRAMGFELAQQKQVLYRFIDFVDDDPATRQANKAAWN